MRVFSLVLPTCWKSLYLKEAASGVFSRSRDNYLLQFIRKYEMQGDTYLIYLYSVQKATLKIMTNCYF